MLSVELAEQLGVRPQTLRAWVAYGLMDGDVPRGRAYDYSALDVLRARLIAQRKSEGVGLKRIAGELRGMDRAALAVALGDEKPAGPRPPLPVAPLGVGARVIELMPGLTLTLREDAPPIVQRIAYDIASARWPSD